ncbi:MAG: tellurium resistance protein TerC [Paraglaciecola sp.]|nr:tellurium resistance protein TerC [Paraglaciecola sp.]
MKKKLRIIVGSACALFGVIFFILPGSMFVLLLGLVMLSYDFPKARNWLRICQKSMSKSARKLDKMLLNRKLRH